MYAILQQSGHQYRVSPGDRLLVDRLTAEVGTVVALEPVVLVQGDEGSPQVGTPTVEGARVAAVVVSHRKGAKIRVFKYKPKKRYRRTHGHRSLLTELRVEALLAAGDPLPEARAAEPKPARAAAKAPAKARAKAPAAEAPAAEETKAAAKPSRGKARAEAAAEEPQAAVTETAEPAETAEMAETGAQGALPAADQPAAAAPKRSTRTRAKKAEAAETTEKSESETSAGDGETETEA